MLPLLTMVSVPTYAEMMTSTTAAYISGLFTDLLPWALAIIALTLGGLFVRKVIGAVLGGVRPILGGKKGGRRGRRK